MSEAQASWGRLGSRRQSIFYKNKLKAWNRLAREHTLTYVFSYFDIPLLNIVSCAHAQDAYILATPLRFSYKWLA